jgi:hypothetical protein
MSPGVTTVFPQAMGTLISPGPSLSQPPAETDLLNTGNLSAINSSTSRIAPSTTRPPSLEATAECPISSPKTAFVVLPLVLTTSMSPGCAISMALWTMIVAGRAITVTATPQA